MASCPECNGRGTYLLLYSHKPCRACNGTGEMQFERRCDEVGTSEVSGKLTVTGCIGAEGIITTEGESLVDALNAGNTASGTPFIYDYSTPTTFEFSDPGPVVFADNHNSAPLTLSSGNAPEVGFYTGSTSPNKEGVSANLGSLFMVDTGTTGEIYIKTGSGNQEWSRLSTAGESPQDPYRGGVSWDPGTERKPERGLEEWALECANSWADMGRQARWDMPELPPHVVQRSIPIVAPMHSSVLFDLMCVLEQKAGSCDLFMTSWRDFADMFKIKDPDHIRWEGKRCWLFGIEVKPDRNFPVGMFAAISNERKLVFAELTR